MTRIDKACYERGCACHDDRVDGETVEVVQRTWVGLTNEEVKKIVGSDRYTDLLKAVVQAVEAKLKEKNCG